MTFVDWFAVRNSLIRSSLFFFLMIRRPPRSTLDRSSAASDVYKRQPRGADGDPGVPGELRAAVGDDVGVAVRRGSAAAVVLSLIHISEPTRPY